MARIIIVMLSQGTTAFDLAAFTFEASFAFILVAKAASLAMVAVVKNSGMRMGFLLTDNWETSTAAAWNINSTTWGGRSSAKDKAVLLVIITIPVIDPALTVWSTALEGQSSGIEEVHSVNVSNVKSHGFADSGSLATRNTGIYNN